MLKMIKNPILLHCAVGVGATALVAWLRLRPFGILLLVLLAIWVYQTRCSLSIKIVPPEEITSKLHNVYNQLIQLRKDRPGIFCGFLSAVLVTSAIIGHLVSGSSVILFVLIIIGVISTKYNIKIIQVNNKDKKTWADIVDDVDDFLPEVNASNLFVLQNASDQVFIPSPTVEDNEDSKFDEIPSDLLIPDSIPEIDENSDASSDDELILTDIEHTKKLKAIEFQSGYFKKDSSLSLSSSSDEENLSKGLNFQDYTIVDGKETQRSKSSSVLSKSMNNPNTLPNLVTGLVSWSMGNELLNKLTGGNQESQIFSNSNKTSQQQQQQQHTGSSDESDFEIVNSDDLNIS